jgi:hypothetical protein
MLRNATLSDFTVICAKGLSTLPSFETIWLHHAARYPAAAAESLKATQRGL